MSGYRDTGNSGQLSPNEQRLLQPLLDAAQDLGHTPLSEDIPGSTRIIRYFGNWYAATTAAGLPSTSDPKQHRLRAQYRRDRKALERADERGQSDPPDGELRKEP